MEASENLPRNKARKTHFFSCSIAYIIYIARIVLRFASHTCCNVCREPKDNVTSLELLQVVKQVKFYLPSQI